MDIYCTHCGEPWEMDTIHDLEGTSYKEKVAQFSKYGCGAFDNPQYRCQHANIDPLRSMAMEAALDICGDDLDGAASFVDDINYLYG